MLFIGCYLRLRMSQRRVKHYCGYKIIWDSCARMFSISTQTGPVIAKTETLSEAKIFIDRHRPLNKAS